MFELTVKLFKTTTCPFCKMEAEFLHSKGVNFEEIYVDKEPDQAKKLIEESGQMGVPFLEVTKDDGSVEKILGFDKAKVASAVGVSE